MPFYATSISSCAGCCVVTASGFLCNFFPPCASAKLVYKVYVMALGGLPLGCLWSFIITKIFSETVFSHKKMNMSGLSIYST